MAKAINTYSIINQNCETSDGGPAAAKVSTDLESRGYNDWYLPSFNELFEMYNAIGYGAYFPNNNIGGFAPYNDYSMPNGGVSWYWSSTQFEASQVATSKTIPDEASDIALYLGDETKMVLSLRPIKTI